MEDALTLSASLQVRSKAAEVHQTRAVRTIFHDYLELTKKLNEQIYNSTHQPALHRIPG